MLGGLMYKLFAAGRMTMTTLCLLTATRLACAAREEIWSDDSVPAAAVQLSNGNDSWNWIASNPSPLSGSLAHQSDLVAGYHDHYFTNASNPLVVQSGEV